MRLAWTLATVAVLSWAGTAGAADEEAPDGEPPPDAPEDGDAADEDAQQDAAADAAEAAAVEAERPKHLGLRLQGSLGFSDCTGGSCSNGDRLRFYNSRIALGLEVSGWYRFLPLVSVGGGLHYNLLGVRDRERVSSSAAYWNFEIGGRVHPLPPGPIDAFAGLTFGYLAYSIDSDFSEIRTQQTESTNSLFVAISVGGEYYVAPRMSVGGLLKITLPFWLTQCFDTELGHHCESVGDLPDTVQDDFASTVWYLGGTFSYHLGG